MINKSKWTSRGVIAARISLEFEKPVLTPWWTPGNTYSGCKVSQDSHFLYIREQFKNIYIIDHYNNKIVKYPSNNSPIIFDISNNILIFGSIFENHLTIYDPITDILQVKKLPVPIMKVAAIAVDPWTTDAIRIALLAEHFNFDRYLYIFRLKYNLSEELQYEQSLPYDYSFHLSPSPSLAFQPEPNLIVELGSTAASLLQKRRRSLVQLDLLNPSKSIPFQVAGYEDYDIYDPIWSLDGRYVAFYFKPPNSQLGGIAITHSLKSPGVPLTGPQDIFMLMTGPMGWTINNELVFCTPNPFLVYACRYVEFEEQKGASLPDIYRE